MPTQTLVPRLAPRKGEIVINLTSKPPLCAGIIAEYNPFHRGHAAQIQALRERGFTHIVAVMSPDYVQRGEPALTGKRIRAEAALLSGCDLILELPLPYALAGAQRFAAGAVGLIHAMGCVDYLAFGVETEDLALLEQVAVAIDSPAVKAALSRFLAQGLSFAKARQLALESCCGVRPAAVLSSPNNILAVEYIRQLQHLHSPVKALPLLRYAVGHDSGSPTASFASASYLRKLAISAALPALEAFVPRSAFALYQQAQENGLLPASLQWGERAVLSRLRSLPAEAFLQLADCSEGIENRLSAAARSACSLEELYLAIKTKRYTLARVRRLVLGAYLGVPGDLSEEAPPYLRVLGFRSAGIELLSQMKRTSSLPVSTSLAKLETISPQIARFTRLESSAADLYSFFQPSLKPCGLDYEFRVLKK